MQKVAGSKLRGNMVGFWNFTPPSHYSFMACVLIFTYMPILQALVKAAFLSLNESHNSLRLRRHLDALPRFTVGEDQSVISSARYILELPGWVQHTQLPRLKAKRLPVSFWANSTQLEYITCRRLPIVLIRSQISIWETSQSSFLPQSIL